MDPVIDRALVIAGVVVCWKFELLPRWMLAVLIAREVFMLIAGQYAIRHGVTLKINWPGRWAVWPVMSAIFFGLCGLKTLGDDPAGDRPRADADRDRDVRARRTQRIAHEINLNLKLIAGMLAAPALSRAFDRRIDPMDTFPDLGSLSDQELKDLIQQLTEEEIDISYKRRILHGKIDILRAELVNRLRKKHETGEDVITGADVQRLTDILAGRAVADGEEAGTE